MGKFLLPLSEYNRIYQVIHGVPGASAEKACLFFVAVGGYVLNQSYKIRARIVAGAFCFCPGDGGSEVATFGKLEGGQLVSGPDAFHAWLQTDTHIIDFMAPIYREAFAEHPRSADLPRKMMQRHLDEEAPDLDALVHTGDFRYYPDPALTDKIAGRFPRQAVQRRSDQDCDGLVRKTARETGADLCDAGRERPRSPAVTFDDGRHRLLVIGAVRTGA